MFTWHKKENSEYYTLMRNNISLGYVQVFPNQQVCYGLYMQIGEIVNPLVYQEKLDHTIDRAKTILKNKVKANENI